MKAIAFIRKSFFYLFLLFSFCYNVQAMTLKSVTVEAPVEYDAKTDRTVINNVVNQYIGQGITVSLLNNIVANLNSLYATYGFIGALALYPHQDASDGNVKIVIDKLKVLKSRIVNQTDIPYKTVYSLLEKARAKPASCVNNSEISDHLNVVKALGAFDVDVVLTPVSQSDLDNAYYLNADESFYMMDLVAKKKQRFNASVYFDNYGTKATGKNRLTALFGSNNLTNNADRGFVGMNATNKGQFNTIADYAYLLPNSLIYVGANLNYGAYSIKKNYELTDVKGDMSGIELYLQNIVFSDPFNMTVLKGGAYFRNIKDRFDSFDIEMKRRNVGSYINIIHDYHNVNRTALFKTDSRFSFCKTSNKDEYSIYSESPYFLLNSNNTFDYFLSDNYSLNLRANFQLSNKEVDPVDLFNAGGNQAIYAYQSNLAAGDLGIFISSRISRHNRDILNSKISFELMQSHIKNLHSKKESFYGIGIKGNIDYKGFFSEISISKAFGKHQSKALDSVNTLVQFGYNY